MSSFARYIMLIFQNKQDMQNEQIKMIKVVQVMKCRRKTRIKEQ